MSAAYPEEAKNFRLIGHDPSAAWGGGGMPLWEALRLIRMGFVMAFLDLPAKQALLDVVGQRVYDTFADPIMVDMLRDLVRAQSDSSRALD